MMENAQGGETEQKLWVLKRAKTLSFVLKRASLPSSSRDMYDLLAKSH